MTYEASPMTAELPIAIEEVEALIAVEGKGMLKDTRKMLHMLNRMRITIIAYRNQIRSLNNDIQQAHLNAERGGAASTLNPKDAVRYLAPDQLSELVEGHLREKIAVVERANAEAQRARSSANADLSKLRFAVTGLLEDTSISGEVKEKFQRLLNSLPENPQQGAKPQQAPQQASQQSQHGEPGAELEDLFS